MENTMTSRLNYGKTFLLGIGFFGVSVVWGVYNAFVPIFLSEKFGLDARWVALFMTLDNIAALFIQPPVGAWSDRLRTPLGRRIPFIIIGAPITAVAFGLVPLAAALPLFVACTSTLLLSAALWRTPLVALMPDITPSEFRSQANGIINFMGGIGVIVALQTGGLLYNLSPNFPFWLGSGLVIISALVVYLFIEEPKEYLETEQKETPNMLESLQDLISAEDKSGLRILLAIFFWFIGYSAVETFFTLYAKNHLGLEVGDGATLLSVLPLFFVLSAIPAGIIAGKIGRRIAISIGLVTISTMFFLLYITPASALLTGITKLPLVGIPLESGGERMLTLAGVFLIICGISWALININSLPMVVDLTDTARIGTFTGLYYLFSTFSAIVGPNINGWVIQLMGNNYNMIMITSPIFMLIAFWLMLGVKKGEANSS
jgi:maltose/moltooligosaccharide transporter